MTVKSLTDVEKSGVAFCYAMGRTIDDLAFEYKRSRRTIIRVLEELGYAPVTKRRSRKLKPVAVVIPAKTPWWKPFIVWAFPVSTGHNLHQ